MRAPGTGAGFTLLELIVVMALMSVGFTVSAVAMSRATEGAADDDAWSARVQRARWTAVREGAAVVIPDSTGRGSVVLLPDGRAVGSGVDPLTGRPIERGHPVEHP